MTGETDLNTLLQTLSAKLIDDIFVFVTLKDRKVPDGINPFMVCQEIEGTTLILHKSEADAANLTSVFESRMITLDVHSSLDAVGFMAVIATKLAAAGIGVNPVAGFYHDHIFVPDGREQDALRILTQIAEDAKR